MAMFEQLNDQLLDRSWPEIFKMIKKIPELLMVGINSLIENIWDTYIVKIICFIKLHNKKKCHFRKYMDDARSISLWFVVIAKYFAPFSNPNLPSLYFLLNCILKRMSLSEIPGWIILIQEDYYTIWIFSIMDEKRGQAESYCLI